MNKHGLSGLVQLLYLFHNFFFISFSYFMWLKLNVLFLALLQQLFSYIEDANLNHKLK